MDKEKAIMKYVIGLVKDEVVITKNDETRIKLYMLTKPNCIELIDRGMFHTLAKNFIGLLTGKFDYINN